MSNNRFILSLMKRARELILLHGSQNVTLVGKWKFVRLYTNLKSPTRSKPTSFQGLFLQKIGKALKTRLDENNQVYDKDLQRSFVSPGQKTKNIKKQTDSTSLTYSQSMLRASSPGVLKAGDGAPRAPRACSQTTQSEAMFILITLCQRVAQKTI